MSVLDYFLVLTIAGYSLYLIFRKKKPASGCCGNCANCRSGCHKK